MRSSSSASSGSPLLRRAMSEKSLSTMGGDTEDDDDRFLRDIQTLSRSFSIYPRRSSGDVAEPNPKPKPVPMPSSSKKPLLWRSLKALSHIGQRRLECVFSLRVHSVDGLPAALNGTALTVRWRRAAADDDDAGATGPVRAMRGAAEFEETLTHRCSVYYTRGGPRRPVHYEPRPFAICAAVVGSPEVDLGKHQVDLARLLPITTEEMAEEENAAGRWSTSLRLSGAARGAMLNVSLGFSILKDGTAADPIAEKKISEILYEKVGGSGRPGPVHDSIESSNQRLSTEDVKVLHEIPCSSKSDASVEQKDENSHGGVGDHGARCRLAEAPVLKSKRSTLLELLKGDSEENECDETKYTVIEQGVEICSTDRTGGSSKVEQAIEEHQMMKEMESAFASLSIRGSEELESPKIEENFSDLPSYADLKSKNRDSAILSMLGIDESSSGLSSDSDPDSPRERLWRQFKNELLASCNGIFHPIFGEEMEGSNHRELSQDYDLSSVIHETEPELHQAVHSKSNAKMVEDEEAEALMHEWGLNKKTFQYSPPGDRSRFGSPIDIPSEKPLELPLELLPLGEGLGPFIQTKGGGFLRSMNPSLFENAKNNGGLIMQVSCPIVVPAEMGTGVVEILQHLASMGIERLSMQASQLMPLEDITGKSMGQISREAAPSLEASERHNLRERQIPDALSEAIPHASGESRKDKGLDSSMSSDREMTSEYVSLENLAPLAMSKIETLSFEGLRIQSGMSEEEALSNASAQSIGEVSVLNGKEAKSKFSIGLEGAAAGLQLLDVKDSGDNVDGLIGLSLTLDEWIKLDSGIINEEDQNSERTSKVLAAHHANSEDLMYEVMNGAKKGGKRSSRRWGLLSNNFTVALMVQLRDPLRNNEPVGMPMLGLVQVERILIPPNPNIYSKVSEKGNSEQDEEEAVAEKKTLVNNRKKGEADLISQFKVAEVHIAGLKTEPSKRKLWGNPIQQQSASRWLIATGMGKSNSHTLIKSKAVKKSSQVSSTVQKGDTLWSISSCVSRTYSSHT